MRPDTVRPMAASHRIGTTLSLALATACFVGKHCNKERGVFRRTLRGGVDRSGHHQYHPSFHTTGARAGAWHNAGRRVARSQVDSQPPSTFGIDLETIAQQLQTDGVAAFSSSLDKLRAIETKQHSMVHA